MPKVNVDLDKCTGCYACVDTCPMTVFEKDNNKTKVVKEQDCISCKACEIQCPQQCIKIED